MTRLDRSCVLANTAPSDGESHQSTAADKNCPSTALSPTLFPSGSYRRLTDRCPRVPAISESLLICGEARRALSLLPAESVQTVVTSPPYWSLRDYKVEDQIGRDDTLHSYICSIVETFDELRRVLRRDGTVWLNVGDSYTSGNRRYRAPDRKNRARAMVVRPRTPEGLKPKDLIGVPWRLALALQDAGWWIRSEVIWHKPNAHPESVHDRPTKAHETVFLLSKEQNYYYDTSAVVGPNGEKAAYCVGDTYRASKAGKWSRRPSGHDASHAGATMCFDHKQPRRRRSGPVRGLGYDFARCRRTRSAVGGH